MQAIVQIMNLHQKQFSKEFLEWFPDNLHVWSAFEDEAFAVIEAGFKHYSARTIVHVIRHHTAIREMNSDWKINNNHSPYLARLWALNYPQYENLFSYRTAHKAERDNETI